MRRSLIAASQGARRASASLPSVGTLSAYYASESTTYFTAAGITDEAEKFQIDLFIKRLKAKGIWSRQGSNAGIWLMCQGTEAPCLVNMLHPGTHDLVKNGVPTFGAFDGVSSDAITKYYDSTIPISGMSQNSASIGGHCVSSNAGVAAAYDMGAVDASSSTRLLLLARTTTDTMAGACMGTTVTTLGASTDFFFGNIGCFKAYSRTGSANFNTFNTGIRRVQTTNSSIAPVGSATIKFLFATGSVQSAQKWALFFVMDGLTDDEMAEMAAATKCLVDSYRYAKPKFQPAGFGDATPTYDVVIYGASVHAVVLAYQCKRLGMTCCIVGDWQTKHPSDIGGHPANGLSWIDAKSYAAVTGFFRTLITYCNVLGGVTDSQDQNGMSVYPDFWNKACLRACDPTRTGSTFAGADIPIYFTGGIYSAQMTTTVDGPMMTGITTVDGRVFTANVGVAGCDPDGDILPLANIPYTRGCEAAGAGNESINGYDPTDINKPRDSVAALDIDPYVTPGDSNSGRIAGVDVLPALPAGSLDAILEAINSRLMMTTTTSTKAPLTGNYVLAAPPGYDAANYERFGRMFAASTALGHTYQIDDLLAIQTPISQRGSSRGDCNNGSGGMSTDMPKSGEIYMNATGYAGREVVRQQFINYQRGLFYWIVSSGDSRIPAALKTAVQAWGLASDHFLDGDVLYWPNLLYLRDPIYQLNNSAAGGLLWNGNDLWAVDGTTPRSTKTIAVASYNADRHAVRLVDVGGKIYTQGSYGVSAGLGGPCGSNLKAPIPMEIVMPSKSYCINFVTPTYPSWTKVFHSSARMEFTLAQMSQACAFILKSRKTNNIPVQDVDYTNDVRTPFLAVTDLPPLLPQTN